MDTNSPPERLFQTRVLAHDSTPGRSLAHTLPYPFLAAVFAGTLFSAELTSQPAGIVSGTVTAGSKLPVADARVRLLGTDLTAVTRVDGVFHVVQVPAGRQTLEVRMVGYTPQIMPVDVLAGATLHVSLVLEPLALETVSVTAEGTFSPGMGGFNERRAKGNGRFFTREQIEKMQARQVTDVLRRVPGMQIQTGSGTYGGMQTAQTGRNVGSSGSRTCPVAYYVNGTPFPLSNDVPINHYITPEEVVAIEVYSGASQTPAQFNATTVNSRCGVVVIWTRSGGDARVFR